MGLVCELGAQHGVVCAILAARRLSLAGQPRGTDRISRPPPLTTAKASIAIATHDVASSCGMLVSLRRYQIILLVLPP